MITIGFADIKGTGIGVCFREIGFIWISVSQGPSKLSIIERCLYYTGVLNGRFYLYVSCIHTCIDKLKVLQYFVLSSCDHDQQYYYKLMSHYHVLGDFMYY